MIHLDLIRQNQPVFNILRASAGSGKTFNLVRVYLALCLVQNDPRYFKHILAITFTNKAANEMKERVLEAVRELSGGEGSHIDALSDELHLSHDILTTRAERIYTEMMSNYGLISIMTIDKFVNRLVRSFSRELTLDSEFKLELDQNQLIREGVDLLLSRIGDEDKSLTKVIEKYALQRVDDEQAWDMRGDLTDFGKLLFNEQVAPLLQTFEAPEPAYFLELHDRLIGEVKAAQNIARDHAKQAVAALVEADLKDEDFFRAYLPKFFKNIQNGVFNEPSVTIAGHFMETHALYTKKTADDVIARIEGVYPELEVRFHAILDAVFGEEGGRLKLKSAIAGSMYQLATLQQLDASIKEVRNNRNIMTLTDLNRLIELLVSDNPAPFIYERLGERYRHFLIDEFQDTSVVQWQNFLPLIDESLARSNYNLIVGDGKQAIYRWRNGDVRQLQQLPKIVGRDLTDAMLQRQATLERTAKHGNLGDNWRSKAEVVNFNNALFNRVQDLLGEEHKSIYFEATQNPKGGEGGWVTAEAYYHRTNDELHEERMERLLKLIKLNTQIYGMRYSDLTILVRDNKIGSRIARSLAEENIPTVTSESLQLGQHPAPWAVIALLKWLSDQSDMQSAAWFIQCFSACRQDAKPSTDQDFKAILRYRPTTDESAKKQAYLDLAKYLKDNFDLDDPDQLTKRPLYDSVNAVVNLLGLGGRYPAYAEALLQMAFNYQNDQNEGIPGFISYWESDGKKKSIQVSNEIDGVKVMTVHKSKGLEFKVVIHLVGSGRGPKGRDLYPVKLDESVYGLPMSVVPLSSLKDTEAHDQYMEETRRRFLDDLNVAYVGMTRAAEHLHVLLECNEALAGEDVFDSAKVVAALVNEYSGVLVHEQQIHFGEPILKAKSDIQETSADQVKTIGHLVNTSVAGRMKVSVDYTGPETGDGVLDARRFGDELHALLARMVTKEDLQIIRSQRLPWQRMNQHDWMRLLDSAEAVVTHPESKSWFDGAYNVWSERELMLDNGDTVRPDRIVDLDDHLLVVDFKTGNHDVKHKKQVQMYVEVLQRYETRPVKGCLFYTEKLEVVEV